MRLSAAFPTMGGDLGGLGETVPKKFEVGDGLCIRPPIFWEVVLSDARESTNRVKKGVIKVLFFENKCCSREECGSYMTFHTVTVSVKHGGWLKEGHQKFWPWKWEFFPKKTSFRNLGLRNFFPSPKTRRQVSACVPDHRIDIHVGVNTSKRYRQLQNDGLAQGPYVVARVGFDPPDERHRAPPLSHHVPHV